MKQTFTRTLLAVALFVTSLAGYAKKTVLINEQLPQGVYVIKEYLENGEIDTYKIMK